MYDNREKDELRVKAKEYVRLLIAEFKKAQQGDREDATTENNATEASRLEEQINRTDTSGISG
jgi:hypothetical protein